MTDLFIHYKLALLQLEDDDAVDILNRLTACPRCTPDLLKVDKKQPIHCPFEISVSDGLSGSVG